MELKWSLCPVSRFRSPRRRWWQKLLTKSASPTLSLSLSWTEDRLATEWRIIPFCAPPPRTMTRRKSQFAKVCHSPPLFMSWIDSAGPNWKWAAGAKVTPPWMPGPNRIVNVIFEENHARPTKTCSTQVIFPLLRFPFTVNSSAVSICPSWDDFECVAFLFLVR